MSQWPILPREDIVDRVLEHLEERPRRAVLLRGPSGIGKTTVAARVASTAAKRGLAVAPIVALDTLTAVPLGAFAPILSSGRFAELGDTASRYQELLAILSARSDEYLLIVDDAPLLDEVSAAGVYQLVRVMGVRCVVTARDGHPLSGPLARLLHEDLVTEVTLSALSIEQCSTLLREHLGGAVQPDSVRVLFESSRGNPMFLRELSYAATRADAVHAGPHGLEIERTRLPAHVVDGVAERLALLGEEARLLAELIAVAPLWPRELCSDSAFDELLDTRLAELSTENEHAFVRLSHPVYGEALIQGMTSATLRERRESAAERLMAHPSAPVRFSGVRLAATVATELLEWAAGYAWAVGDHTAAVDLASKAIVAGGGSNAHLALASALSALGRSEQALESFERARSEARDDRDIALIVSRWSQHLALRSHAPSAAVELVVDTLASMTDATARAILSADLLKWKLMAGQSAGAASVPDGESLDAPGVLSLALGQAMIHTMAGDVAKAREAVALGAPLAAELSGMIPHASSLFELNEFLILVADARTGDAADFAAERRLEPFTDAAGLWSYALALVHQQRGELARAEELAALAVEQLTWRDFTGLLGAARALHATVLAQRGLTTPAGELLSALEPAVLEDPKVVLQSAEARAWILVADGNPQDAAEELAAAGQLGIALGHPLLASIALTAAVRFGEAAAVVDLLDQAAAVSSSPMMSLAARYARASHDADAEALEKLAPELSRAGLGASAVAGLSQAVVIHERAGRGEAARRATLARATLRSTGQDAGLALPRSELDLTDREFEVATLAGERVRSRQIAERLGLSTRTVDNHLARIYRKLGINGRAELEELIGRGELPARSSTP